MVLCQNCKKDIKYTMIGKYIEEKYKHITHFQIPNTGHNCHLENPKMYSNIWLEFMNNMSKEP